MLKVVLCMYRALATSHKQAYRMKRQVVTRVSAAVRSYVAITRMSPVIAVCLPECLLIL